MLIVMEFMLTLAAMSICFVLNLHLYSTLFFLLHSLPVCSDLTARWQSTFRHLYAQWQDDFFVLNDVGIDLI